ncbi:MAG TPA: RNA polymerase sigma-70 factor [Bacteroidales bacterium]|nr:RNA polymerase sigma-70 factor [Bacteroidales bacterium]
MEYSDQQLVDKIRSGDIAAFETIFNKFYIYLCLLSEHLVRNQHDAEEIVSDVFMKVWNIREKFEITTSLKAYLIRAVYNASLNHIESNKFRKKLTQSISDSDYEILVWDDNYPLGQLFEKEILEVLDQGINSLPDGCRQIFLLSRNENMKYSDIAQKQGISVNTVKTQMKIALSRLRENLKVFLS